jgi:predicted GH43/DUF377 family glycosyl hydrolase
MQTPEVVLQHTASRYCRCMKVNKREYMTYSARENNITCKAIWWMARVQAV